MVADFGVAKALETGGEQLTATGMAVGTPQYMSPEQATGGPADSRTDIYALGCVLYEMLAGEPPFTGRTPQAVMAKRMLEPVPRVRTLRDTVPDALQQVLTKALARVACRSLPECGRGRQGIIPADRCGSTDWPAGAGAASLEAAHPAPGGGCRRARADRPWGRRNAIPDDAFPRAPAEGNAARGGHSCPTRTPPPGGFWHPAGGQQPGRSTDRGVPHRSRPIPGGDPGSPGQVAEVLARMERPDTARLDPALAREIAIREGIKGVVTGEIARAGPQYVLSAQVIAAKDGEVLTAHRVTASDSTRLIAAVDQLSGELRARVGESLRAIDREPPLERVTTASLPALRQYSAAVRAGDHEANFEKAVTHLEEAVALDTGFAMAYRTLGMHSANLGKLDRMFEGYEAAMQRLDRLTDRERHFTLGDYYFVVKPDLPRAATAYEAILEDYPNEREALIGLGNVYWALRRLSPAESLYQRALAVDSSYFQGYNGLMLLQITLKQWDQAQTTYEQAIRHLPNVPYLRELGIRLAERSGDYATARARAQELLERFGANPGWRAAAHRHLAIVAAVHGQLMEAERHLREAMAARLKAGRTNDYFAEVILLASLTAAVAGEPSRAASELERALAQHPLRSLQPMDRPYAQLATAFARAGRVDRARALLAEYEQVRDPRWRAGGIIGTDHRKAALELSWGHIALAERRWPAAIARFRAAVAEGATPAFGLPDLGHAYDLMGQIDSAIAVYERYLDAPDVLDEFRRFGQGDPRHRARRHLSTAGRAVSVAWREREGESVLHPLRGAVAGLRPQAPAAGHPGAPDGTRP